ncbi:NAD(P)-dependent dehydrogenase (short-subunit alcohol dehydrogenase family) [Leifsonia sp. EB41]|uniref:SDR family oxidoreductase n=1 Tax=Leifsonia sp. EB41 TaxID=3156260 RepID=UPI003518ABFB
MSGIETLEGAVVVVTGASAGVGRAAAVEFGRAGARVALLARGEAGLEAAAEEVRAAGGKAITVPVDVADADAVETAAERVVTEWGRIDVWVNCAFSSVFAELGRISPDEFRRTTEVSYLGFVYGTMAALRRMRPAGRGTIVQIGSALAYRGIPLQSAYCGAKHAIVGFTESVRTELLHDHSDVAITMVHLPAMNTPQFRWLLSRLPQQAQPVPPIYQPEVAARTIVRAAVRPRRAYWVGISTVQTIIGNRLIPGLLDHYLGKTGYASQQTDEARPADQPVNLWEPADQSVDHGTHGPFGDRSKASSVQAWSSRNRRALGAVGAALAGVVFVAVNVQTLRTRNRRL